MALSKLLQISRRYPPGSDEHYVFCYLAKPFVAMGGPALSGFTQMKISAMKTVFDKQHSEETIPLIRMLLLDCGDKKSSDALKEVDANSCCTNPAAISFTGKTVEEDKRILYNFRCMLMYVVTNLDDGERADMITLMQDEISYEPEKNDLQTLLLLFEKATQGGIILPQKLDRLKDWLSEFNREDLIRYINQFEPKKQFPGLSTPILETGTARVQKQYSDLQQQAVSTTVQPEMPTAEVVAAGASGVGIAFTGPDVTRKAHLGSTGKQESGDSAYGEGDPRERCGSCDEAMGGKVTELVLQRKNNISPNGYSYQTIGNSHS